LKIFWAEALVSRWFNIGTEAAKEEGLIGRLGELLKDEIPGFMPPYILGPFVTTPRLLHEYNEGLVRELNGSVKPGHYLDIHSQVLELMSVNKDLLQDGVFSGTTPPFDLSAIKEINRRLVDRWELYHAN
jgi:hypothetical protein